jgi:hypothetical protein
MSDDHLSREHGRLVARLKRLVSRADVTGLPLHRVERIRVTVCDLIITERLMALDPLERKDRATLARAARVPSNEDVKARLALMTPGGGIEVPR